MLLVMLLCCKERKQGMRRLQLLWRRVRRRNLASRWMRDQRCGSTLRRSRLMVSCIRANVTTARSTSCCLPAFHFIKLVFSNMSCELNYSWFVWLYTLSWICYGYVSFVLTISVSVSVIYLLHCSLPRTLWYRVNAGQFFCRNFCILRLSAWSLSLSLEFFSYSCKLYLSRSITSPAQVELPNE